MLVDLGRGLLSTDPGEDRAGPPLLERIALALTSTLDLAHVLELLARVGLDATGAGGVGVLLLDGRSLTPAAVVREIETDDLQGRFHGMRPIELDSFRYSLLREGRVLALEDARDHDLIPREWVDRFVLRGVALVPLMAEGEPCGVMVVDWDDVRSFASEDIAMLEALGAYAGIAVRNARSFSTLADRARIQAMLARSAARLAAPLAPREIAARLADAYMELLDTRLCAVALLDPKWRQITTLVVRGGRAVDGPIAFRDVPGDLVDHLIERLSSKRRPEPLDRHPWLDCHIGGGDAGVEQYMAVPVVLGDYARGVVLLGFGGATVPGDEESSAAEVLAGIAAAAVERYELLDRLDTQVNRLAALQEVTSALNSSASADEVLAVVCSAFESILRTSHCSVNLIGGGDPNVLRTLAHRGISWFAGRPESVSAVPRSEVASLVRRWTTDPSPVVYDDVASGLVAHPDAAPDEVRSAVLFPMTPVQGVIVCGFPHVGRPPASALEVGRALADLASAAIDRARLNDALHVRLRQVEALYGLSDVVATTADINSAVAGLNQLLRPELRARVGSLSIVPRRLRDVVGARAPDSEEADAVRAWRKTMAAGGVARTRPTTAGVLVPVVHRRRVHGALRVSVGEGELAGADEDLLVAIGSGCGEIIHKTALQREVAEHERRLTVLSERERIAHDLHDSVGQVITGMGMLLTDYVEDAPDEQWRERLEHLVALAQRGSRDVRESIHALLFLDSRRGGLSSSLRELAARFSATSGLPVQVSLRDDIDLIGPKEDVLFRAAHEALTNVEKHSQATAVTLTLDEDRGWVTLQVVDDGVGLPEAIAGIDQRHFGLSALRQRVDEVGGEFSLRRRSGRGTTMEVRVRAASDVRVT